MTPRQVVAAAREKQDRERIEPLRLAERAALTLACKEVNLGQMRDRRELEESRREDQRLQHGLQLKTYQAQVTAIYHSKAFYRCRLNDQVDIQNTFWYTSQTYKNHGHPRFF